jgi:hypothetical protein
LGREGVFGREGYFSMINGEVADVTLGNRAHSS